MIPARAFGCLPRAGTLRVVQRTLEPEVMDTADEAAEYDAMDHREPNAAFVQRLFELGATDRMLDIGTGPGHIPLLVCERDSRARVVGVDLARHMLEHAERHRAGSPYAERVEYRLADAKGLGFGAGEFDAVFSNTILHHIPDPRPFLAEAFRVLPPGGALLLRDLFRPGNVARVDELVELSADAGTEPQRALCRASLLAAVAPPAVGWPVLFTVHGLGGGRLASRSKGEHFARRGYFFYAIDVRGQGTLRLDPRNAGKGTTLIGLQERRDVKTHVDHMAAAYPGIADTINELIRDTPQATGATQIVVTHDMESAYRIADRIAMLYQGRSIAEGTPEEIQVSDNPIVRQFIHGDTPGPLHTDD